MGYLKTKTPQTQAVLEPGRAKWFSAKREWTIVSRLTEEVIYTVKGNRRKRQYVVFDTKGHAIATMNLHLGFPSHYYTAVCAPGTDVMLVFVTIMSIDHKVAR